MRYLLISSMLFFWIQASAQSGLADFFKWETDIGQPALKGTSSFNSDSQSYTIKGSGYNIWFERDQFHFLFNKMAGDFILTADFEFIGTGANAHRKYGWMVRESEADNAPHVSATVHGDGLTVLQWRELKGAFMRDPEDEIFYPKRNPRTIQMERRGRLITMRVAGPGEPLQTVGSHILSGLKDTLLAGLFICSHDSTITEEARVWNVRIDRPVPEDYSPEESGWIGSRLEVIDVHTGLRKEVLHSAGRLEAPNWMPDGRRLLYNQDGSLFSVPVEGGRAEKLNTGSANRLNNDHGISFDGKWLAISHHLENQPGGGSAIFVLPLSGGEPRKLTEQTPSYWHGWNPNNREILFVGKRGDHPYDIYKLSVNGGREINLTNLVGGHVDGPEYSPDGKFIYYNANPTGTMQIWRMKPDGTAKEQLTFDAYHNWFPHISPDGKWMVFISFPPDINPSEHPSYKRVMLRIMPLTVPGSPRVIAVLFGGQGTINVPSWSPDSQRIAFVSNTKIE